MTATSTRGATSTRHRARLATPCATPKAVAGLFGVVLGLLTWFGLQATVTVYVMEVDVVRARHLWPRSIPQPPLTDADKQFLTDTTNTEVRRPEQHVSIDFTAESDHDPLQDNT